eukprot:2684713-Karenia_brevis.AAC.1
MFYVALGPDPLGRPGPVMPGPGPLGSPGARHATPTVEGHSLADCIDGCDLKAVTINMTFNIHSGEAF